jgi:hypothetical protein
MTGQPASDFSSMKVTDMRDNVHEGETSFVPHKSKEPELQASFSGSTDQHRTYAAQVATGPYPNQGSKQISKVTEFHRKNSRAIVARGTQAKH